MDGSSVFEKEPAIAWVIIGVTGFLLIVQIAFLVYFFFFFRRNLQKRVGIANNTTNDSFVKPSSNVSTISHHNEQQQQQQRRGNNFEMNAPAHDFDELDVPIDEESEEDLDLYKPKVKSNTSVQSRSNFDGKTRRHQQPPSIISNPPFDPRYGQNAIDTPMNAPYYNNTGFHGKPYGAAAKRQQEKKIQFKRQSPSMLNENYH